MVQISTLFVASIAISVVSAMPAEKRIAQTITDATTKWVAACVSSHLSVAMLPTNFDL